ncbi:MAG: AI-2E family transporter [Acidimicrobiales bacterium]
MSDAAEAAETLETEEAGAPSLLSRIPRLGLLSWSFVGFVLASIVVLLAFGAVSEIALPMVFAAVLAVMFKPSVGTLQRHNLKPSLAAGLVVLGLLLLMVGVVVATVRGVVDQVDEIGESADAAVSEAAEQTYELGIDEQALDDARAAVADAEPMVTTGALSGLVEGVGTIVAAAGGVILGSLIMYYLLKDGTRLRRSVVSVVSPGYQEELDAFIGSASRTLRDYGKGRTVMSAVVSAVVGLAALLMGLPLVFTIVVVNFVGGYIPYIGAFLGGGLAVVIAVGEGGLALGALMVVIVLAANLVLENFVEPKVMGRTLDIHPVVVLVVTALGGLLGGIVGLMLAVPAWVIAGDALQRLRSGGVVQRASKLAEPTVKALLD